MGKDGCALEGGLCWRPCWRWPRRYASTISGLAYMPPEIVEAYPSTREDKNAKDGDAWYFVCPKPKAVHEEQVRGMYGMAYHDMFIEDRGMSYHDAEDIYLGAGVHFYHASTGKDANTYFQYPVLYQGKVGFVIEGHGTSGGGGGKVDNVLSALRGKTSKANPAMIITDGNYTVAAFKKDATLLVISGDPKVSGGQEIKPLSTAAKKRILAKRAEILAGEDKMVEVSKKAALERGGDDDELVWASVGQGEHGANDVYRALLKETFLPRGWTFDAREEDGVYLVWDLESPNMTKGPQLKEANAVSKKAGLPGMEKMGERDKIVYISHGFTSQDGSAEIELYHCLYVHAKTANVKTKKDVEVKGACVAALVSPPRDPNEPFGGDVELLIFDIDQSKAAVEKAAVEVVKGLNTGKS